MAPVLTIKTFDAFLELTGGRLNWTVIRIPVDVQKTWGVRGQLRVRGDINGFNFRTSLFPDGKGGHFMMVNKMMQAGAHVRPGESARFRMEPDFAERILKIPTELTAAMRESRRLTKYFESLNVSTRRDIANMISGAKQAETRKRRAERMAERLMETMEAEHGSLPPQLELAFRRNPSARRAWMKMGSSHKRQHLLGIFYYRNPESRARRIAKAVEELLDYAKKHNLT
jgi:uncharacterized protein YdeI (YjbR/CyaY-like superfamily)